MEVPIEQQPTAAPQPVVDTSSMTPEQQEEMKLRMKYPNPHKPGGSTFIQKMLHRGNKKYFDSGDYNMAKSRTKAALINAAATTTTTTTNTSVPNNSQIMIAQKRDESMMHQSGLSPVLDEATPVVAASTYANMDTTLPPQQQPPPPPPPQQVIETPTTTTTHQTHRSPLSSSSSSNESPIILLPPSTASAQTVPVVATAATAAQTSPLHHHHHHGIVVNLTNAPLLTSSTSNSNIEAAQNVDLLLLDADEIGHGIPTPECLPQSRKHSMTQSKLAAGVISHLAATSSSSSTATVSSSPPHSTS